jgi:IMP dehydrogenase
MANKKDEFFKKAEALGLALTFDDVRLRTAHSKYMPDEVSVESRFSKHVPLKIPIVSAAMDTVTEHKLAIAMAKAGGLGIIHRNMNPKDQATEVARVKYHLNGIIDKPICVLVNESVGSILKKKREKGYSFSSFPVVDGSNKLVGIITGNDLDFCDDHSAAAAEIMEDKLITVDKAVGIDEAYNIMKRHKKKVLPVVDKKGRVAGLYTFSDLKRIKFDGSSLYNVDRRGQLRVGAAIGTGEDTLERVALLIEKRVDVLVIDTAHGDSVLVLETLRAIKEAYGGSVDVVAGNISEAESVRRLLDAGADGVKVGQGPGSICTTRIVAGIGTPQVTAVYNCSKEADRYNVPVCADGGIRYSGDIPIAIGAGATSVMLGSMLAGTKESPGELIFFEGRQWKSYRGMGSLGAMEDSRGSRERYRQKEVRRKNDLIPEGIDGMVPYKGEVSDVLIQYVGGLRRGMGYVGVRTIEELRQNADFIRLSQAGSRESHPHDVKMVKEPPNYQRTFP